MRFVCSSVLNNSRPWGVISEPRLFTGRPALLRWWFFSLCAPSLSHFLSPFLLIPFPCCLEFCLSLCRCHFLCSPRRSSAHRVLPSPFFFKCRLPTFSLRISPSTADSSASALLPVRATKPAHSHTALLSQHNEIGSTQIERSHFLQLSTYYRGGTDLFQYL